MAHVYTLEEALDVIINGQYGKDVRQAIYDGIYRTFEEGHAGSTDLVAREGITNLTLATEAAINEMNLHSGRTVLLEETQIATANSTLTMARPFTDFDKVWIQVRAYPQYNGEFRLVFGNGYKVTVPIPHWADYTGAFDIFLDIAHEYHAVCKYVGQELYTAIGGGATKTDLYSIDEFPLQMYDDEDNQHELDLATRNFKITNCTGAYVSVIGYGFKGTDTGTATGLVLDTNGIVHFV